MKSTIPFLTTRPGKDGVTRYFWQPSARLRAEGWRLRRVPDDWESFTDPVALEAAAIAAAREITARMIEGERTRAEYDADNAVVSQRDAGARTVDDLIRAYRASDDFGRLRSSTKKGYTDCLNKIGAWAGDAPVHAITPQRVQRLKTAMAKTPAYANAVVRVIRLLFSFARRAGWVKSNPADRPRLHASAPSGIIWPREAVAAFVEAADAMGRYSIGTAVELNAWMGQRQGDVLRLPRSIYRNGSLTLRQSKTGAGVCLPMNLVPHLRHRLEDELRRQAARNPVPATIIVSEETGRPYVADNFRHLFATIRAKAAEAHPTFEIDQLLPGRDMDDPAAFVVRMEDLTFMHLRHTAVTRLAEADCETHLIAAVTGHAQKSVGQIIERYMVRTTKLARAAFAKRLAAEGLDAPEEQTDDGIV